MNCANCGSKLPARDDRPSGHRGGRQARFCGASCRRAGYAAGVKPVGGAHRGIPGTSDRLYDDEEFEFLKAMERYKRENRRPFPTFSEVLAVARSLGYRKGPP